MGPGRQLTETLVAEGRARLVYRHLAAIGEESVRASEASECAAEQGQFWAYHDRLYQQQARPTSGYYSKDNLKLQAAELGLDGERFNTCFDSGRYARTVRAESEAGRKKGVSGTPTVFVNDRKVEGAQSLENILRVVQTVGGR